MSAAIPTARTVVLTLLEQDTPIHIEAHGPSMSPTILDGDLAQVRPIHENDLRKGTIVLGKFKGRILLHRLVSVDTKTGTLSLVGDAGLRGADRIGISDAKGIVTSITRNTKTIRLNTLGQRWTGMLRYYLRPIRRLIWGHLHPHS